jgi:hypothetical protein
MSPTWLPTYMVSAKRSRISPAATQARIFTASTAKRMAVGRFDVRMATTLRRSVSAGVGVIPVRRLSGRPNDSPTKAVGGHHCERRRESAGPTRSAGATRTAAWAGSGRPRFALLSLKRRRGLSSSGAKRPANRKVAALYHSAQPTSSEVAAIPGRSEVQPLPPGLTARPGMSGHARSKPVLRSSRATGNGILQARTPHR